MIQLDYLKEIIMLSFFKFIPVVLLIFLLNSCSNQKEKQKEKEIVVPEKITYLFVTQPSCPSCDKLEEKMNRPKPKELLSRYFDIKKIYLGEPIPSGLMEPNGTPTVYFLGTDNEVLVEPMIGEKTEKGLMEFLEDALSEFKITYHVDLVKKYNKEHNITKLVIKHE